MPIKNYTTRVNIMRTAGEISAMLMKAGASAIMIEYDEQLVSAISFRIKTEHGPISFRLPVRIDGVEKVLEEQNVEGRYRGRDHAARVGLRILKDWIDAQLAINDAGLAELAEVFLPYAQNTNGVTVYEGIKNAGFKLLTHEGGTA